MNYLVLGGAGFIGSHVVDALTSKGHSVRVFDLPNVSCRNLETSLHLVELINGDFTNISEVSPALDEIDTVIHLVSTTLPETSMKNPAYDVETNVIGTLNILNEVVKKGIKKIIFPSSGGTVYGIPEICPIPESHATNPICSHGINKLAIEKYLALYNYLYGLDYCILRFGNPYGPRQRIDYVQGAIAVFLGRLLKNEPIIIWGDGSVSRDYFFISDLVSSVVAVSNNQTRSKVYNIASGYSISLNEILSVIREVTGKNPAVHYNSPRKFDVPVNCLDISKAQDELNWSPQVSLHEGIERTWKWLLSTC